MSELQDGLARKIGMAMTLRQGPQEIAAAALAFLAAHETSTSLRERVALAVYGSNERDGWLDLDPDVIETCRLVADDVLAVVMPLREVDLAQRLVLTLGERRYPVRSLEKAGDRITLTAELETP